MEEKRKREVCEGDKDEKGTKWRGQGPMKPNLVKNLGHWGKVTD